MSLDNFHEVDCEFYGHDPDEYGACLHCGAEEVS